MRPALIAIAAAVGGVACHAAPIRTAASDSLPRGTPESALVVVRRGSELGYSGELAASGLERLAQLYDPTVRTLRIRSGGGSIGVGMDFGEWVHEHRLDVVVVDYCSSSCANYVFTAGVKKTIEPGSVVDWHGNAWSADADDVPKKYEAEARRKLADYRRREDAFFAKIQVNECVCRIGRVRFSAAGFFTMSANDMERFGITTIARGPAAESEIDPAIRRRGRITFVTLPPTLDLATACPKPG